MRPTACFRAGAFFVVLLVMFFMSGKAHAATFCVDTADELQAALNTAATNSEDDIIAIKQGTYTGNFSYVSYQPYDLGIGGGFGGAGGGCTTRTADASNTILDAEGSGNVLYVYTPHDVTIGIDAITLQNGNTVGVGQSINTLGADNGGGLYVWARLAAVSVSRSTISDNTAFGGGGVYVNASDGVVTLTGNDISNNTAYYSSGGGVYLDAGSSLFEDNAIDNNYAEYWGGGVFLTGMTVARNAVFTDNTISNNTAYYSGGGVYVENGQYLASSSVGADLVDVLTITGGTFDGNSSNQYGGGLYSDVSDGSTVITNATFSNNTTANGGGAYFANGGDLALSGSTFHMNTASVHGGGLKYSGSGDVSIANSTFDMNSADESGGGAYIYDNSGEVSLTGNAFTENSASDGSGGGAYMEVPNAVVDISGNNTFTSNTANSGSGGAVSMNGSGGTATIDNNTFEDNSSYYYGGGVHVSSMDDLAFTDNEVTGNTTNIAGAGLAVYQVGSSTIEGNTVTGNDLVSTLSALTGFHCGGGINIYGESEATITDNDISDNTADSYGGGMCVNVMDATLSGNAFDGNSSDGDGGGAYLQAYTLIAVNNVASDNASDSSGGGLYVNAVDNNSATLTNNTVTGNTAPYGGGVYVYQYYDSDTIYIFNNIIWGNEPPVGALNVTNDGTDLYLANDGNNNETESNVNLYYNDFDQSAEGFFATIAFTPDASNLDNADPLFFDAGSDDYHLWGVPVGTAPPVADMGDDSAPQIPTTDKDGNDRIIGDAVDMGAYEFAGMAVPDLKVNDDDGPLSVTQGTTLTITGSLSSGAYTGEIVEAFASVASPLGTFWRTLSGWVPSDTPVQLFEGPLADFPTMTLFVGPAAMTGDFTIEFTMDTTLDNDISEGAVSDSVAVTVTPPTRARK